MRCSDNGGKREEGGIQNAASFEFLLLVLSGVQVSSDDDEDV